MMTPIAALIASILNLINVYIIPLLVALAVGWFFWGIVLYIKSAGGDDKHKALDVIGSGIIGLVVMLSVWGIVALVGTSFGISGQQTVVLPQVQ